MSSHSISASMIYKNERRHKTGHHRMYKTNLLNLVENKLDCKRNCHERRKLFEIRRSEVCTNWKRCRERKCNKLMSSRFKTWEKITRLFNSSLSNCSKCRNRWILWTVSGEFQEIESNHSGRLSHVSSQPEMIPNSRALLSRDKRLPLDTWSQSGVQENAFGNQFSTFDSPSDFPQRISSDDVQRNREAVPLDLQSKAKTSLTSEDGQNYGTIPLLMFASRPLTTSSKHPVDIPQNYLVGQQRQQISELQFDRFPNPSSFLVWKTRFKTQVSSGSDFPSEAMLWIKEVEMVDSLDELKSSRSVHGKDFPNFEMLDAKIASALNKITQHSHFK